MLLFLTTTANAQISYSTAGDTFTEDFDNGLPNGSANLTWTDNPTFTGYYAFQSTGSSAPALYRRTNGASSDAELFQWRDVASAGDGALRTQPTDSTGDMILGFRVTNNTGATLNSFSLGYTGEQWVERSGENNNQLVVAYQLGNPANLSDGSWTDISSLEFNSPFETTSQNLDGSDPANQEFFAPTAVSIADWADGTDLWIRWYDNNSSSVDQGLAIDAVSFSAIPEPSTLLLVLMSFVAAYMLKKRKS